jgi:hypothetical protein
VCVDGQKSWEIETGSVELERGGGKKLDQT